MASHEKPLAIYGAMGANLLIAVAGRGQKATQAINHLELQGEPQPAEASAAGTR